jgi:RNA polymerase sigma-70 factor (ECF subfamily)
MARSRPDIEEEFARILESCGPLMNIEIQRYNLAKYGLDPDDILQDVKIRIWQVICDDRRILSPPAYIKKIISSAVIDQLRKRQRDDGLIYHEEQIQISEQKNPYSWDSVRKKAMEETVGRAVEKLIGSRRQVVKLYLLSLTIPEISSYLNWTQDKTRNLLYRGLADLKGYLRGMGSEDEHRAR